MGRWSLRQAARTLHPEQVRKMRERLGIQLTEEEILAIARPLARRGGCAFLVFGTGHDSEFWCRANDGGRTVFLEDDLDWVSQASRSHPGLSIRPITYGTERHQWRELICNEAELALGLEPELSNQEWHIILVDGPRGYEDQDPGRMKSIYFASRLISPGGDIFVHDCNRVIESTYCDKFLANFDRVQEVGRLRHYRRPVGDSSLNPEVARPASL